MEGKRWFRREQFKRLLEVDDSILTLKSQEQEGLDSRRTLNEVIKKREFYKRSEQKVPWCETTKRRSQRRDEEKEETPKEEQSGRRVFTTGDLESET